MTDNALEDRLQRLAMRQSAATHAVRPEEFEGRTPRGPRRRVPVSAAAAAIVIVVVAAGALALVARDTDKVDITAGAGPKLVEQHELDGPLVQVMVSIDTSAEEVATIEGALDAAEGVVAYGRAPIFPSKDDEAFRFGVGEPCRLAGWLVQLTEDSMALREEIEANLPRDISGSSLTVESVDPQGWFAPSEPEVFMNVDATQAQIDAVRAFIEASPQIVDYTFLDKQAAYEEFLRIYTKSPELIENVTPEDVPTSFRFDVAPGADLKSVTDGLRGLAGVKAVHSAADSFASQAPTLPLPPDAFNGRSEILMSEGAFSLTDGSAPATPGQVAAVREALASDDRVVRFEERSAEQNYEQFQRDFGDKPPPVDIGLSAFGRTFTVDVRAGVDLEDLASDYSGMGGVGDVGQYPGFRHCTE